MFDKGFVCVVADLLDLHDGMLSSLSSGICRSGSCYPGSSLLQRIRVQSLYCFLRLLRAMPLVWFLDPGFLDLRDLWPAQEEALVRVHGGDSLL